MPLKRVLLSGLLFLLTTNIVMAGGWDTPVGARQSGMGRSSVVLSDLWSLQNNQAGISLIKKTSAGIYFENRFLLRELSTGCAGVIVPTRAGVLGSSLVYFGYTNYYRLKIGIAYARSFGPFFRIGVQLDYLQTSIGGIYGKKSNLTFEAGIQSDVTENLTIGAWVFNPVRVKLADYNEERLPAIFRFGFGWNISKSFLLTAEAEKNTEINPIIFRAGLEYSIQDKFFIRGGFSSSQEIFSMGFGMTLSHFQLNISAVMHQTLGFSFQTGIIVKIGKK